MSIYFNTVGEVQLSMCDMIQTIINLLPNGMFGEDIIAAPSNLFDTSSNKTATLLEEKVKDLFHTIIATTLFTFYTTSTIGLKVFLSLFWIHFGKQFCNYSFYFQ